METAPLFSQPTMAIDSEMIKACCTAVYQNDWVRFLIGDSLHPGGLKLTEQIGQQLGLGAESRVLDVASGTGTSAFFLAERFGCQVVGVDLALKSVTGAQETAAAAGLTHQVQFEQGDAERLPFPDDAFDAVICECALCTFPNKRTAVAEFARVLKPGGQLGLSDLTRNGSLPATLDSLLGWVACIADAQSIHQYTTLLSQAGFEIEEIADHTHALSNLVRAVQGKLLGAELLIKLNKLDLPELDFAQGKQLARQAATAARAGRLGYVVILAKL